MKKMVFCGFMSVMCMVAVGVDKPAPSKAPGERPRVEAKKPDEVARPSVVQPDAKPVVARKPGEARKPAAGARAPRGRTARGARKGAPVVGRPPRGRVRGVVEAGSFPTSPAERRLIEAVEDAETSRELSRLMPQVRMRAVPEPDDIPLSPADSRLIDAVDDAETMMELSRLMPKVLASHNPEVRQSMVDALEDQGARSVNDLAYFMADPDLEVADSAFSAWTSVLEDTSPARRIAAIRAAARILTPPPAPAVQP